MAPLAILTELETGLADYPVQQVLRQRRCVILFYADKMQLDLPSRLRGCNVWAAAAPSKNAVAFGNRPPYAFQKTRPCFRSWRRRGNRM